ncbi:restriction endonuclease subunit S [Turicibacter sanguinis]|uniref:restriction endonuclease subunit S n=1 Tax=Turicibacter sanguinis TaxID=154288 RepID=UPI0029434AD2|nr:restriction endonuclease subunit S [Turicibacter sanguinis]
MNKVPNLRFKGFNEAWQHKKLCELADVLSGKRIPKGMNLVEYDTGIPYITVSDMGEQYVDMTNLKYITPEIEEHIRKYKVLQDDIIISVAGTLGKVNLIQRELENANLTENCDKITNLKETNYRYLYYYLNTVNIQNQISSVNTISSQPKLALTCIRDFDINIPSLEEQEKIASFFSLIDKKIELQNEKFEELKNYKKGIMQKIFSQELRFKDEDGNEYPEWEEVSLYQIGATYTGLSGKTKEDFGFGNGSFVTYMNVFNNTLAKQVAEQVNVSEKENQNLVLKGDLLFTTSSETPNEVGMVSCWDYEMQNLYLNSFCFGYRLYNQDSYLPIFLAYMLRSGGYRKKISILAQGSTRYNISKTELMKMKVQCPVIEEQQKIVALLLNLESKLEHEQNKLNEFIHYKKGLLQQMFI